MSGTTLFQRAYRLVVGTLEIKTTPGVLPLEIRFNVKKTLKPEPNKAEIHIWNLTAAHRSALAEMAVVPVSLEAGYEGDAGTSIVFLGNLRTAVTSRDGADLVTTISSGDKQSALRTARVNKSFAKGAADAGTIFKLLASSLGVTEGNLSSAAAAIAASPLASVFSRGCVLSGSASREMTALCRSVGYTWSVQDGALQLIPRAKALAGTAIVVSASTGMLGSPTVDNKGVLNVSMLMAPDLFPGRLMKLDALYIKGSYRIEETEHVGDIAGEDWNVNIKAKAY